MKFDLCEVLMVKFGDSKNAGSKAVLLALAEQIEKAVDSGWSKKLIWQALREEGKINCCYLTFLRHVKSIMAARTSAISKTEEELPETASPVQVHQSQKQNSPPDPPPPESRRPEKTGSKTPTSKPDPKPKRKFDPRGYPFEVPDETTGETKTMWSQDERGWGHIVLDEKSGGIIRVFRPYPQKQEDIPQRPRPMYAPDEWDPYPSK